MRSTSSRVVPSHRDVTRFLRFAHSTFVDVSPETQVLKVAEEVEELLDDPSDAEELADVLMTVLFLASVADVDLRSAFHAKVERNLRRKWSRGENGTWSHVEDEDGG